MRYFIVLFTLLMLAIGCNNSEPKVNCRTDENCPSFEVCQNGKCLKNTGGEGQQCNSNGSCDSGLVCKDNLCVKVSSDVPRGGEGQQCRPNRTCATGLECKEGLCLKKSPVVPKGGLGQGCKESGVCDAGLECKNNICAKKSSPVPRGGEGQQCKDNDVCDAGLVCKNNICVKKVETPRGGEGQQCKQDGSCNIGLVCDSGLCRKTQEPPRGGEGQRCKQDGSCNAGFECKNAICVKKTEETHGEEGQQCKQDGSCNAGLECKNSKCIKRQQSGSGLSITQRALKGSRLRVRYVQGSDGSKSFIGFYDTKLKLNCTWMSVSAITYQSLKSSSYYCYSSTPQYQTVALGNIHYLDSNCRQEVGVSLATCNSTGNLKGMVIYSQSNQNVCSSVSSHQCFEVSGSSFVPTSLFSKSGGKCVDAASTLKYVISQKRAVIRLSTRKCSEQTLFGSFLKGQEKLD